MSKTDINDTSESKESLHFIETIVEDDLKTDKYNGRVHTRFPPEPNGYIHIGHAKSICLNFELAQKYGGKTNLRFDDTNPATEDTEFVNSIKKDVRWLGFDWEEREFYASDYFEQLYAFAIQLIKTGKAYVDDSTPEEMRAMRGDTTKAGTNSPFRERSIAENLELFEGMKNGDFEEGSRILRAKIDMASPNMHLRDPAIYRIKKHAHHRTGDKWNVYPMYDFAHGLSDSIEGITHSLCTLEFEVHRPLYDWFLIELGVYRSQQIEFARFNLSYTIMSKRKLKKLVEENYVENWDDPRMPTISGLRRRGYPPAAIRKFIHKIGVARRENVIDLSLLEFCVREELNKTTDRVMAVLNPLKVTITNYPEGQVELMHAINNPEDETAGSREIPFSRELYVERDDFMLNPSRKYFRLAVGRTVRLKNAYIIHCDDYIVNAATGEIDELLCSYYPDSRSGSDTSGVKAKGTLHWVSIPHAITGEVRLYDRLFSDSNPDGHKDKDFLEFLNPNSLQIIEKAYLEPSLQTAAVGTRFQFMRNAYFNVDDDSTPEKLVFNRIVTLKDGWKK